MRVDARDARGRRAARASGRGGSAGGVAISSGRAVDERGGSGWRRSGSCRLRAWPLAQTAQGLRWPWLVRLWRSTTSPGSSGPRTCAMTPQLRRTPSQAVGSAGAPPRSCARRRRRRSPRSSPGATSTTCRSSRAAAARATRAAPCRSTARASSSRSTGSAVRSFEPGAVADGGRGGRHDRDGRAARARDGLLFPPDPGAPEQSQLGGTSRRTPAARTASSTASPGVGHRARGRHRARRARPLRRPAAQGRRRLRPARAAVRQRGHARDRHGAWLRLFPAPEAQLPLVGAFAGGREGCDAMSACWPAGSCRRRSSTSTRARSRLAGAAFPGGALRRVPGRRRGRRLDGGGGARRDALTRRSRGDAAALRRPSARRAVWRWREGVSLAVTRARGGSSPRTSRSARPARRGDRRAVEIGERHGLEPARGGTRATATSTPPSSSSPATRSSSRARTRPRRSSSLSRSASGAPSAASTGWAGSSAGSSAQWAPAAVGAHEAIKRRSTRRGSSTRARSCRDRLGPPGPDRPAQGTQLRAG